nr:unnamed protein product [Callosobruchus analis]
MYKIYGVAATVECLFQLLGSPVSFNVPNLTKIVVKWYILARIVRIVLCLTLINIFINELFSLKARGAIVGFADDPAIMYEISTWPSLKNVTEGDIKHIILE